MTSTESVGVCWRRSADDGDKPVLGRIGDEAVSGDVDDVVVTPGETEGGSAVLGGIDGDELLVSNGIDDDKAEEPGEIDDEVAVPVSVDDRMASSSAVLPSSSRLFLR